MESNWRFNVWDFGMAESDWRLAARTIVEVQGQLSLFVRRDFVWIYVYTIPAFEQLPVLRFRFLQLGPGFPGWYDILEPD